MKILIIDGVAFRLTKSGIVESTFAMVDLKKWSVNSAEEVGLSGGELDTIRQTLARIAQLFPDGRPGMPKSEPSKKSSVDATEPV